MVIFFYVHIFTCIPVLLYHFMFLSVGSPYSNASVGDFRGKIFDKMREQAPNSHVPEIKEHQLQGTM